MFENSTTPRSELKDLFRAHAEETRHQIANLERCFELLGEKINDAPSPTTKGLAKEGKAAIAKTDARIVDAVLLAAGLERWPPASELQRRSRSQREAQGGHSAVVERRLRRDRQLTIPRRANRSALNPTYTSFSGGHYVVRTLTMPKKDLDETADSHESERKG